MAVLPLSFDGADVLRERASEIPSERLTQTSFQAVVEDMIETMYAAKGVGLAAPQVGKRIRLIVVDIGHGPEVVINPVLAFLTEKNDLAEEGCLSAPGRWGQIRRVKKLRVTGLDRRGNKLSFVVKGFHARVYQHEVDHLEGILIVDKFEGKETR